MKNYLISILSFLTILSFTGCSPSTQSVVGNNNYPFIEHDKITIINDYKPLAFIYFDDKGQLIGIYDSYQRFNDDKYRELVFINERGFYPKYYFEGELSCVKKGWGLDYSNVKCNSIFTQVNTADGLIRNSLIAISSLGFSTLYGAKASMIHFDYEKFYKLIEENALIEKRKEILAKLQTNQ